MKEKENSITYLDYIENAVNYLKTGQYGAALNNLYLAKECGYRNNWKKDFEIMLSGDENDSWGNLCLCIGCTELGIDCIDNGCCGGCCAITCVTSCCAQCCTGDIDNASTWLAKGVGWFCNCICNSCCGTDCCGNYI